MSRFIDGNAFSVLSVEEGAGQASKQSRKRSKAGKQDQDVNGAAAAVEKKALADSTPKRSLSNESKPVHSQTKRNGQPKAGKPETKHRVRHLMLI